MLTFNSSWTEVIAKYSTAPEFQTLRVQLIDPATLTTDDNYNPETGLYTTTVTPFWSGPARLVSVRWGSVRENAETANPNTQTSILVQFGSVQNFGSPSVPRYRIKTGTVMYVTVAPQNPALLTRVFTCTSDMQSGDTAATTLEFESAGDAVRYV